MAPPRPLLLLSLFLPATALAQDPQGAWRTVETEHFRLHYPLEAEAWSLSAAQRFETIHAQVTERVDYEQDKVVDVVVLDPYAMPNGFAMPSLRRPRMGVYTSAPGADSSLGYYRSWVEVLVVHEDTHLTHMLRPSRSKLRRPLTTMLGYGPVALKTPLWMIEGYAVYLEGQLTGAGRPNADLRASWLRVMAREGTLPGYKQLNGSDRWLGGAVPYLVGSAFVEWLVAQHGEQSLRDLWARLTARKLRGFKGAFEGVYGDQPDVLYDRFCAEITHAALEIDQARPVDQDVLWREMTRSTGLPALAPDGSQLAVVEPRESGPPRLLVLPTEDDGELRAEWEERVAKVLERDPEDVAPMPPEVFAAEPDAQWNHAAHYTGHPRWMPDGEQLLFSAWVADADGSWRPDLFTWKVGTAGERRITHAAGLHDPDPSPDGSWAVAVRQRWGASQLVRVTLDTGEWTAITEPSVELVLDHPRISPDGQRIAYLRHAGGWELVLRDVATGNEHVLPTPMSATILQPAWRSDGQALFLSVGQAGFQEVWELPLDGAPPRQLTHSPGAAFGPSPTPDGSALYYLSMDSEGLDLNRITLDQALASTPPDRQFVAPVVRPAPPDSPPELVDRDTPLEAQRYGLGRPGAKLLMGAALSPHWDAAEIGLRFGDVIGRWDLLAMGGWSKDQSLDGAALTASWRRLPVTAQLHGFLLAEAAMDRRAGGVFDLEAGRELDWGSVDLHLGAWMDQDVDDPEDPSRTAGFASLDFEDRSWRGPAWLDVSTHAMGQGGFTGGTAWWQADGSAGLGMGWYPLGIEATYGLGTSTQPGDDAPYRLGGMASSLTHPAHDANRVLSPLLAPGSATGASHDRWRAAMTIAPLALYAERHRFWPDTTPWGTNPTTATVVGLELDLSMARNPIAGIPGLETTLGVGCLVEDPDQGLFDKPCTQLDHYGAYLGLTWTP